MRWFFFSLSLSPSDACSCSSFSQYILICWKTERKQQLKSIFGMSFLSSDSFVCVLVVYLGSSQFWYVFLHVFWGFFVQWTNVRLQVLLFWHPVLLLLCHYYRLFIHLSSFFLSQLFCFGFLFNSVLFCSLELPHVQLRTIPRKKIRQDSTDSRWNDDFTEREKNVLQFLATKKNQESWTSILKYKHEELAFSIRLFRFWYIDHTFEYKSVFTFYRMNLFCAWNVREKKKKPTTFEMYEKFALNWIPNYRKRTNARYSCEFMLFVFPMHVCDA